MKILMVNKFLHPNGGSETYTFKLGEGLSAQGHEVQYFGMDHEKRCVGNRVNAYTKNMDFHSASRWQKLTYPLKTIYSSEARRKIRMVLDDFQPDICHLNNFNYQLTPSIILEIVKWRKKTGKKCKIVFTAHDYQLLCPNHSFNNPFTHENCEKCINGSYIHCLKGKCIHGSAMRSAIGMLEAYFWHWNGVYRHIDTIICCSEFMKRKMDCLPMFANKTVAMHNFVEPLEYVPAEKKDYVLYFGRYSEEKGIRTLVEACRELPDINFVFAGSGPLEALLEGIPNVRNVGFQTGEALHKLIREARFSVYPSEWYENCPFSVMESIMLGTPVLGANIGGIPELIEPGVTGELFESGNCEELKKFLRILWTNERKHIVVSNMENQFCSVERYCCELLSTYNELKETIHLRNVILVDWEVPEQWTFHRVIENETAEEWEVKKIISNRNHGNMFQKLIRYLKYFILPAGILFRKKHFSKVLAWQQFFGIILAFYFKIFRIKRIPDIYIMTFIYKEKRGILGKIYERFIRYTLDSKYIKKCICYSESEKDYYSKLFGKKDLFESTFVGQEDLYSDYRSIISDEDFYLAAGRSNRDYDFLANAWDKDKPYLKIVCDEYSGTIKSNITILNNCYGKEYYCELARCTAVIIPLEDENISSGQLVILQAMMFGKPVIVTKNKSAEEYIKSFENGIIIDKTPNALNDAIEWLRIAENKQRISKKARIKYVDEYSIHVMGNHIAAIIQ